jgi:hypothetical protein
MFGLLLEVEMGRRRRNLARWMLVLMIVELREFGQGTVGFGLLMGTLRLIYELELMLL